MDPDLTIDAEAEKLIGKTITRIGTDSQYERTYGMTLYFSDGTSATLGQWAEHASDSGLSLTFFATGAGQTPELFVHPVEGGWDGYQAGCHTCGWRCSEIRANKAVARTDCDQHTACTEPHIGQEDEG